MKFVSKPHNRKFLHTPKILILGMLLTILTAAFAVPSLAAETAQTSRKEAILKEAQTLIKQDQNNQNNLRQAITLLEGYRPQFSEDIRFPLYLAEAYYRLADPSADVNREFPYYEKAKAYAQQVLAMDPNRAEAHYWNGLALLKHAQKRGGIGAFFIVREGIAELEKVRNTMPSYDHAGASRVLGLLYCLAPGWTPFGNLNKSIDLGKEATRLAPEYPLNRLYLADAYKKRGDKADAIREYQAVLASAKTSNQADDFSNQAQKMLRSLNSTIQ